MILLNHLIKRELVYEGLIHTTEISTAADMLKKWSGSGEKFLTNEKQKKIQLDFKENLSEKELTHLLKVINNLGWFVAAVLVFRSEISWKKFDYNDFLKNDFNRRWLSFQLESKYDVELNIHDYKVVYHVSPSIYTEKILKIGIVPKSKEKISAHPERIYLADNEDDVNVLSFQFQKMNPDVKVSEFEIDFEGVRKNNPSIRLFDDPNFKGGFYTLSNIPPQFIKCNGELGI